MVRKRTLGLRCHGCETWGSYSIECIEKLHRKALKIVIGVRDNTPNYVPNGVSAWTSAARLSGQSLTIEILV